MTQLAQNRRRRATALAAFGALLAGGLIAAGPASAAPMAAPTKDSPAAAGKPRSDNLRHPQAVKQDALRQRALQQRLKGDKSAQGKVAKVGKGQYVELEREGTDRVFVVLAEFGDTRHASYPDTVGGRPASDAQRFDGPGHNEIPAPDRSVDNSTLWQADYDVRHYEDMYFTRMAKYYETQSSGRYSVDGDVTEWVKVPFNEARYGRDTCGGIVCNNTWLLLRDALSLWTKDQLASGMSLADVTAYLKTFDQQDRYDLDGDGDFAEPDGFIDHFQIVHAGGDQAAGDP
ncbi:MAG TPA: immune inhibitor A domain-containing protein, partial [Vicinamibacteria bacterium]|nr:immune inhibitor A domain-containing protein [Vicinamibacteria bacterium]